MESVSIRDPTQINLSQFLKEEDRLKRDFGLNLHVKIIKHVNALKNTRPDNTSYCLLDAICGDEQGIIAIRIRGNEACELCSINKTVTLRNVLVKADKDDKNRLELDRFSKVLESNVEVTQVNEKMDLTVMDLKLESANNRKLKDETDKFIPKDAKFKEGREVHQHQKEEQKRGGDNGYKQKRPVYKDNQSNHQNKGGNDQHKEGNDQHKGASYYNKGNDQHRGENQHIGRGAVRGNGRGRGQYGFRQNRDDYGMDDDQYYPDKYEDQHYRHIDHQNQQDKGYNQQNNQRGNKNYYNQKYY